MRKWLSDALYDHYDIDLYGQDTRLAYVFVLYRGGERWVFSEEGLSKRFEDAQAYFHHFQYPFIHERDVHRAPDWVDRTVWYQIFPERFANGLGPKPYINAQWGDRPAPDSFFGGDLVGVARHLDYLQFWASTACTSPPCSARLPTISTTPWITRRRTAALAARRPCAIWRKPRIAAACA